MNYPPRPDLNKILDDIIEYGRLKHEYGAKGIAEFYETLARNLTAAKETLCQLPVDAALAAKEPDALSAIRSLRPEGPRKIWTTIPAELYEDKLAGALLSRLAGCTLGAPVEFHQVSHMKNWAAYTGDAYPPTRYWSGVKFPGDLRYEKSDYLEYTRSGLCKVPVDDDISYTLLGLLIAEDYGLNFTTADVGKAWLTYLPYACTAEDVALKNLKKGIPADRTAEVDNPYCQWIGADIRSDPFAYMAPAWPEKAAELAYRDAYLSHRRNGIYGEMYFAAAQSAAFAVSHPGEALEIGLTEIPADCMLAQDVKWALNISHQVQDYEKARALVDKRFPDMAGAHTNNNACLTIFALMMGGTDMSRVIGEAVAMGMDNDCTAATAGSIVGAIVGKKNVPTHWYECFHNTIDNYLIGAGELQIDDVLKRFAKKAYELYDIK